MDLRQKRQSAKEKPARAGAAPARAPLRDTNPSHSLTRFRRSALLLTALILAVLLGWLVDAPGLWLRSFAERALRNNDPHDALRWVARAVGYSPKDAQALLLGARADLQLNMNGAAAEFVDRAAALGTPAETLEPYRWMIAAQRGESEGAERLLGQSESTPLPPEAYEALVRCAQYQDQLPRAELILERLEQSGQAAAVVAYQRGRNREIVEDFSGAVEFYQRAFETQPRMSRAAFRAGSCFYALRDFERAEQMFRKVRGSAYDRIAAIELANALWEQHKLDEAWQTVQTCLDAEPVQLHSLYLQVDEYVDSDRAALVAARIQDALGNGQTAVELLEQVLAYNRRDFEARELLIKNLRQLKREREASDLAQVQREMIAKRQRCRELRIELIDRPRDIAKLCELAELYWEAESVGEAQLVIGDIFKLDPNCDCAKQLLSKIEAEKKSLGKRRASAPPVLP